MAKYIALDWRNKEHWGLKLHCGSVLARLRFLLGSLVLLSEAVEGLRGSLVGYRKFMLYGGLGGACRGLGMGVDDRREKYAMWLRHLLRVSCGSGNCSKCLGQGW